MDKIKVSITLVSIIFSGFGCLGNSSTESAPVTTNYQTTNSYQTTIVINPTEPQKVYIFSVTASPTDSESIMLKNNSGINQDISGWTLGDKNNPAAYSIPTNTLLSQGEKITFLHSVIGFQINDKDEIIYLKDNTGNQIDSWSN